MGVTQADGLNCFSSFSPPVVTGSFNRSPTQK